MSCRQDDTATQNVLRRSFYARRVATRFTNMTKDVLIFHTLAKFCLALRNSHSQAKFSFRHNSHEFCRRPGSKTSNSRLLPRRARGHARLPRAVQLLRSYAR